MAEPAVPMNAYGAAGSFEANAYNTAAAAENTRETIMAEIKNALGSGNQVGNDVHLTIPTLGNVPIDTGAGALVLDDKLQKLSTLETAAGQLTAGKNRAVREMNNAVH